MGDVRVAPRGELPYPYGCSRCGSYDRACVDLGLNFQEEDLPNGRTGAILLCTECTSEVIDVFIKTFGKYIKVTDIPVVTPDPDAEYYKEILRRGRIMVNDLHNILDDSMLSASDSNTAPDSSDTTESTMEASDSGTLELFSSVSSDDGVSSESSLDSIFASVATGSTSTKAAKSKS